MSAAYPLVRNFSDFSTRFGVLTSPSRSGSSPSSSAGCLIRSCILHCMCGISASVHQVHRCLMSLDATATLQVPADDPDALYTGPRESRERERKLPTSGPTRLAANPKDFESA